MKKYAPEIAEHMRGYRPEKWTTATEKIPNNGGTHRLDYEIECLYAHKNQPHDKTTSRVPLLRCPHCGSPKIRTTITIRRVPLRAVKSRRNGKQPEAESEPVERSESEPDEPANSEPIFIKYSAQEKKILALLESREIVTEDELIKYVWYGSASKPAIHAALSRVRSKHPGDIVLDREAGGYRLISTGSIHRVGNERN